MTHLRKPSMTQACRTKLIGEIASLLRNPELPAEARQAGLTIIGWLARRMPQDPVDQRTCTSAPVAVASVTRAVERG
jgi:hypothetical protein